MSFKNICKFQKPFAKISFNSFEDALKNAILYDDLKKLAWRENGVYFFAVNGLAKDSYIETCFTNRHLWNKFEPSDLGDQIGYEFVSDISNMVHGTDRSFITDMGIDPNKRYNKHLVFTNKNMADAYLKYMKNSVSEQAERDAFLDSFDSVFGTFDHNDYDYDDNHEEYEEQDYHYAMY